MRLIDADELLKTSFRIVGKIGNKYPFEAIAISEIKASPTIDPESLRKHGRWIKHDDEFLGVTCECSRCHLETCGDSPYCPHCGARMCEED